MSIAVTGAAGFIGSHLSKALQKRGRELNLIDDLSRGKSIYLKGVHSELKVVDLRDYAATLKALSGSDVVYHTACRIGGVQYLHGSNEKELQALQDNLAIDRNVFKACIELGVKKVIYTSSVSVYNSRAQQEENCIFTEQSLCDMEVQPEGGYGWAKYIGEQQLLLMRDMGIHTAAARIFKSYGPFDDSSAESGQVVLSLIRKAINYPREPFEVWGDGSISRCLLYIDDLIGALLKIEKSKPTSYNLGSDVPVTIRELAEKIIRISRKRIPIKYLPDMHPGPVSRIPDLRKSKHLLNWEPKISLDAGLKKSYHWLEEAIRTQR